MEKSKLYKQLASSQNRRDEALNLALADEIVKSGNKAHVNQLVTYLTDKKPLQNDSIKVLYEIGNQQPLLIAEHLNTFIRLLPTKNNRLQWGLMTTISCLVETNPDVVYNALPEIIDTSDKGSVITKDQVIKVLIKLGKNSIYKSDAIQLLMEQLVKSTPNQLPMYAEQAQEVIDEAHKDVFTEILNSRLPDLEKESKRKRIEKVIKKLLTT